jgi:hypothetical protein
MNLEVVGESNLETDAGTGGEATGEHPEREFEFVTNSITAADLSLQLAPAQIEVVSDAAK